MKTMRRFVLAILVPAFLFFSCGSGGMGGRNPPPVYSIGVVPNENRNGEISIVDNYTRAPAGTTITVYVEAKSGYTLNTLKYYSGEDEVDLIDNGDYKPDPNWPGTGVAAFTMPAGDTRVDGTFEHNARDINLEPVPDIGGTIATIPERTALYTNDVEVTVTPASNYRIMKDLPGSPGVSYRLKDDPLENAIPLYAPYGFSMPDADVIVTANFELTYPVTIDNDSAKGTANTRDENGGRADRFAEGDTVSVRTNVTDSWYVIDKIETVINGERNDITAVRNFTMPAKPVTVAVSYKLNPANRYQVGATVPLANGTIAPMADATGDSSLILAQAGDRVYLAIQPGVGYELDTLSAGDGVAMSTNGYPLNPAARPYFVMPARNVTVTGAFKLKNLNVTGAPTTTGAGTVKIWRGGSEVATAQMNQNLTVTVTANTDYRLKTGTVKYSYNDGTATITSALSPPNYGFTMPGYDVNVSADFVPLYAVTVTNVTPSGAAAVPGAVSITNSSGTATTKFAAGDRVYVGVKITDDWYVTGSVTGDNSVGNISGSFTMPDGPVNVTVQYTLNPNNQYQIKTTVLNGQGTITSKAAAAGDTALTQAMVNNKVYLDIQPVTGYELTPGSLDAGSDAPITIPDSGRPYFDMPPHDVTVSGKFTLKDLNVTGTASSGTGTVDIKRNGSPVTTAQMDQNLTVTLTPAADFRLKTGTVKYSYNDGTGTITSALSPPNYSFAMPGYDVNVSADFEKTYSVTPEYDSSKGAVTISNASGASTYASGDRVNISAVPKTGFLLQSITVTGIPGTITAGYFPMPANAVTVTVTFVAQLFTITVDPAISNGQISASANEAVKDATVTVNVQPDPGYKLTSLKYNPGNNTITNDGSSGSFGMPANNVTITGTFDTINYTLTAAPGTGGSILGLTSPSTIGKRITFTVSPAANFRLKAGSVKYSYNGKDYTPSLSGSTYSFDMPPADVTVSADFEALYSVTVNNDDSTYGHIGNVSITNTGGTPAASFAGSDKVYVSVNMIDQTYVPDKITGDNGVGDISGYFTMPSGAVTVSVTYKLNPENQYSITQAALTNGSIRFYSAASGGDILSTATAGTQVYLDVQPELGYELQAGSLKYSDGADNAITVPASGRPSFTMPAHAVIVSCQFTLKNLSVTGAPTTPGAGNVEIRRDGSAVTTAQMGQSLTVAVTANSGYRFKPGTVKYSYNDGTARSFTLSAPAYDFTMPAYPVTVSADFDTLYTVTLTAPSNGSAQITDAAGNVMASPARFIAGETVKIDASPADSYTLDTIKVNGTAVPGTSFPMPAQTTTVTVSFKPVVYPITVNSAPHGQIIASSPEGAYGAKKDDTVYLDNTPEPGYELKSLQYNDGVDNTLSVSGRPSFTMPPREVTVTGAFDFKTLNITQTNPDGGTISLSTATAKMGDTVTFTVAPLSNYRLKAGSVTYSYSGKDYTPSLSGSTYSFTMPAYDVTVSAEFEWLYKVTVAPSSNGSAAIKDSGGTVVPSPGRFAFKDRVYVDYTPDDGFTLDTINVTGMDPITTGYFTMPANDVTVTVTFKSQVYTISMGSIANGNISVSSPEGSYGAKKDDWVDLYVEPEPGYSLTSISAGTGVDVLSVSGQQYHFQMPARNVTIDATFDFKTLNITKTNPVGGSISLSAATAKMGDTVTFTVAPLNDNFRLKAGSVKYSYFDGTSTVTSILSDPYSFTMPAYDVTVSAEFEPVYTVTLTNTSFPTGILVSITNANGTESGKFAAGERVYVSARVDTDYRVDSIIVNDPIEGDKDITAIGYFSMPAYSVTVTVDYTLPTFDINTDWSGNGLISASIKGVPAYKANEDDVVALTLKPGQGYKYADNSLTVKKGLDLWDFDPPVSTPALTTATFTMPDNSVSVYCDFVKKSYTIQKDPASGPHGSISFINPATPDGGTIAYGTLASIKATPDLGYRVKSMVYYLDGQDRLKGTAIPQIGTTYQFTVPEFDDGAVIDVYVDFVPATYSISVNAGFSNGTFVFRNVKDLDEPRPAIFTADYLDTIIAELTMNEGYYYSPGTLKATNKTPDALEQTPGETQATYQFQFTMPPENAVMNATLAKNKYTFTLVNPDPQNGSASISAATANHGDDLTVTMTPIKGYRASQIKFVSPHAQKDYNIVNPTTDNKYAVNLSDFTGVPTNGDAFTVTVVFIPVNNSLSYTVNPNIQISLYIGGNYIGQNAFVPTGTQVTVIITNSANYRYKPGSLKINGVTPVDLDMSGNFSDNSYYYSFNMPSGNTVVSVESDLIPLASISFDDPNMDSYLYFYGNTPNDPEVDPGIMSKIEGSASAGQTVELRAYIENGGTQENIPGVVVKSWYLGGELISDTSSCTIPEYGAGKTLGVVVEIGGVPHSKSIQVGY